MKKQEQNIIQPCNLPAGFYDYIEPYVSDPKRVILERTELLNLWREALHYHDNFPQFDESIAEWTVSVGSSSPLVRDNDIFEAIHAAFGELEVPADNKFQKWLAIEELIKNI